MRDQSGNSSAQRGGVDVCFGGIGINGHIAFNEPPEIGETISNEQFAALPTRVLSLTRETRTIKRVTVGGEMAVIPEAGRDGWDEGVSGRAKDAVLLQPHLADALNLRRVLHGPITAACPASFLRTHPDAETGVADYVAAKPEIRLRGRNERSDTGERNTDGDRERIGSVFHLCCSVFICGSRNEFMKLSSAQDRVLAVMAHPDDAELLCAGTLARAKADGAAIGIVVMCRGDKGVGSLSAGGGADSLSRKRQEEASAAAEILGATFFWFGCGDGELFDSLENRRKLIEIFRQFRPSLVIAHAGEDYHPDHRAASAIAEAATWFCAFAQTRDRQALRRSDSPSKLRFADTVDMAGFSPGFFVDISAFADMKLRMLDCHRSQLERGKDGDFTPLAALMKRQCETRGAQANVAAAEAFRWHQAFRRVGAF